MHRLKDLHLLAVSVMLALLISMIFASPAFADDSNPPVTPSTETAPPQGGDQDNSSPPPVESVATEPADVAPTESAPADVTITEVLAQAPEGTAVVVLNNEGTALPLASQQAEDILYNGDPMWCPAGVTPNTNVGGCSPNFSTFGTVLDGNLLNWMDTHDQAKAGTIWVAYTYASTPEPTTNDNVTINGLDFTNFQKYALTIQGGWNGVNGNKALNTVTPYSTFNASLSVMNWLAPITINDIVVTGITNNPNANAALYVQSTKNITLNRVQVRNNAISGYSGAVLDTESAPLGSPASVTVNDSVFNNNLGSGLVIYADGAVTVKNITANFNGDTDAFTDFGLYIDNYWDNLDQPVTLSGANEFKGNLGTGLRISSYGAITLNNITASYNDDESDDDSGDGYGVFIDNNLGLTASNVKLTGTNLITFNQRDGLKVTSNGTISISNLTSSLNGQNTVDGGSGAILDTCQMTMSGCTTTNKSVTISGTNNFNGNHNSGLEVRSSGTILLNNITASDNLDEYGVLLDNCAYYVNGCRTLPYTVTITGFVTTNENGSDGIRINSAGAITLNNVTSNFNQFVGASIVNNDDPLKPQDVTINGTNSFNYNGGSGLEIYSYGTVKTNNLTANSNGILNPGNGVVIDNLGYDSGPGGSVLISRKPVTMSGFNTFWGNDGYGLKVYSVGTITINNLTSSSNGADGAYLINQWDWYPNFGAQVNFFAPITLTGFTDLNHNVDDGLELYSHGAVSLNNVTANNNGDFGAWLDTWGFSGPQAVKLTGFNNFMHNGFVSGGGEGLVVNSDGAITISNLNASGNKSLGAYLDNATYSWSSKFLGVTLTGFNTFQGNQGTGLIIGTDGSATLNHVNADRNGNSPGENGVEVYATKNITLICGSAFNNAGIGFYLSAGATLTIKGLQAYYNSPGPDESLFYTTLIRTQSCP